MSRRLQMSFALERALVTRPAQRSELSKKVWTILTFSFLRKRRRAKAARRALRS